MRTPIASATMLALCVLMLGTFAPPAFCWQYGVSMSPTISENYDSVEMPTGGLYWLTVPSSGEISFWLSSTTSGATPVFAQDGYMYNGLTVNLCIGNCTTFLAPNSWGMFYEYTYSGNYYGDAVTPPSAWSAGDQIYFGMAVYTSKSELSFLMKDSTVGLSASYKSCYNPDVIGTFSGGVGAIDESSATDFSSGGIHLGSLALWDQVISSGIRNSGNTYSYVLETPPTDDLTNILGSNSVQIGFQSSGTHYDSSGTLLYSNSLSAANENVPADIC